MCVFPNMVPIFLTRLQKLKNQLPASMNLEYRPGEIPPPQPIPIKFHKVKIRW